jgi:hypothetical protein
MAIVTTGELTGFLLLAAHEEAEQSALFVGVYLVIELIHVGSP